MEDFAPTSEQPSTTFRGGIPTQYPPQGPIRSSVTPETTQNPTGASSQSSSNFGNFGHFRPNLGSSVRTAPSRPRPSFAPRTASSTRSAPSRTPNVENIPETPEEMMITPFLISGLPEWITRNANMVLKDILMYSQLTCVIQALYQTDQEVGKLELVSPEELVEVLGIHYIKQHLNLLANLLVVLAFVVTMSHEPGSYTHSDFLDMREAHLMHFRNVLLDKIRISTRSKASNRVP